MPATSWSGSEAFVIGALPIYEASAGDTVITGVGVLTSNLSGSNSTAIAAIPGTAQAGDILLAFVNQGQLGGSQATGQTVSGSDIVQVSNGNFQSGEPFTITLPAAAKAGDVLVAMMGAFNDQVSTYSPPGSGWTTIANTAGTTGHPAQGLFYHTVTSGETPGTTTYSFSMSSSENSNICWLLLDL
jgi:hypothetical protein